MPASSHNGSDFPFTPTDSSELADGQFWTFPLGISGESFACCVIVKAHEVSYPRRLDPMPEGFLGALLDWVGESPANAEDAMSTDGVLIHALVNVKAIASCDGLVAGTRDLDTHPLPLPKTLSHRFGGTVWLVDGCERIRPATATEKSTLEVLPLAGVYAFRAVAEDRFVAEDERSTWR